MAKAIPLKSNRTSSSYSKPSSQSNKFVLGLGVLFSLAIAGGLYSFYKNISDEPEKTSFAKISPKVSVLETETVKPVKTIKEPVIDQPLIKEEPKPLELPVFEGTTEFTKSILNASIQELKVNQIARQPVQREVKQAVSKKTEKTTSSVKNLAIKETVLDDKTFNKKISPKETVVTKKEEPSAVDVKKKIIVTEPVIKEEFKPRILAANQSQVWVRVDEKTTLMYNVGEKVPGFGTFKGTNEDKVSFDSGDFKID